MLVTVGIQYFIQLFIKQGSVFNLLQEHIFFGACHQSKCFVCNTSIIISTAFKSVSIVLLLIEQIKIFLNGLVGAWHEAAVKVFF